MLISLPILKEIIPYTHDDAVRYSWGGNYPLTSYLEWHNGVHLIAPSDETPVRAVADGKVIHVIAPDKAPSSDKSHPQNHGSADPQESMWTDKGMVIVEHTAEIGNHNAGFGNQRPITFTYYSVYMHLKGVDAAVAKDKRIYRRDKIGQAGQIYGQENHLHFEICMDEANLTELLGHAPAEHPAQGKAPNADGRTDVVFGSAYVYLPKGTPVCNEQPATHLRTPNTDSLEAEMWVQLDYAGSATLVSFDHKGKEIGRVTQADAEYDLYSEAIKRHSSLSVADQAQSSPSGWYELLRFGRNLGRAERSKDPLPADAEHWRKVNTPRGEKWVNLNAKGTYKFSDADFPAVMGWQLIGDDKNASDQRCNSDALRGLLLLSIAEMSEREKACEKTPAGLRLLAKQTVHKDMAGKMQKLICKFPSEFDQDTFEARYGHVKDEEVFKDKPEAWGKFKAHIQALTFKDLPQAYKQAQWQFHPVAFIKHMRQCGWLSHDELVQCIPQQALRTGAGVFWEKVPDTKTPGDTGRNIEAILTNHRVPLNKAMRKYGISNKPLRIASFLGNAIQETGWFSSLQESGGAGQWYAPWFGRGFLQLTHADNYFGYWQWRGRSVPSGLVKALRDATKREAEKPYQDRNKTALQDRNFTDMTAEIQNWRDQVQGGLTPFPTGDALVAPSDSAGFYWAKLKMARYADEQHTLEIVRVPTVNSGEKTYYRSSAFWRASAAVNLPSKVEVLYDTRLNGFDARCCAYGVALAVLTEIKFSDAKKLNLLNFPEGYTPRRGK